MNKWILGGFVLIGLLLVIGLFIRKSVRAEVVIDATPETVWEVLTNPDTYPEWNPIFVAYEGEFATGRTLRLQMKMGEAPPTPVEVQVKDFVPNQWLHQGGGYPTILTYDHNWYLEAVEGGTQVTQYEYYTGLYVLFWDPAPAQRAYERGNANLKQRLETNEHTELGSGDG